MEWFTNPFLACLLLGGLLGALGTHLHYQERVLPRRERQAYLEGKATRDAQFDVREERLASHARQLAVEVATTRWMAQEGVR